MNAFFSKLEEIRESHPLLYYTGHFLTSWPFNFAMSLKHPKMFSELKQCAINQMYFMNLPKEGLKYEAHSHTSNFSPDAKCELSDVVNKLFQEDISVWALTDHNNSYGFDKIVSGEYNLDENRFGQKYRIDVNSDGRSMIIERNSDEKKIVFLRSIEYWTDMGEIGIYGYSGHLPNEGMYPYGLKGKNIPLKEAIDMALEGGGYIVINHPYDNDGIGWSNGEETIDNAVEIVKQNGNGKKLKINREILKKPFQAVSSLRKKSLNRDKYTRKFLEEAIEAVEKAGSQKRFIVIEKNVAQLVPKLFCPVKAEGLAKKLNIPFIATGDAHTLRMYGRSGVVFEEEDYEAMFEITGENHADTVKSLISTRQFKNYSNYPTYAQVLEWLFF
jgi:hypothetical protein